MKIIMNQFDKWVQQILQNNIFRREERIAINGYVLKVFKKNLYITRNATLRLTIFSSMCFLAEKGRNNKELQTDNMKLITPNMSDNWNQTEIEWYNLCSEQYLTEWLFVLLPVQYPTRVRMCAVTSVSSGLVGPPAPALKGPLWCSLMPTNVMQVSRSRECIDCLHSCVSWCVAFCFAFVNPFFMSACLLLWNCGVTLLLILCLPGFCSCSHWGTRCNARCM